MPIQNPVAFIGQAVLGATAGAPLSTNANSALVSGISNSEVTATADTTTTSTTDVLIAGMTITPVSGTYLIMFSTTVDHSNQNVIIAVSIYVGGVQRADTERAPVARTNAVGAITQSPCVATQCIAAVNGAQAIEARWRTPSGTATGHERTLSIVRVA